jgi:hypothetical protein
MRKPGERTSTWQNLKHGWKRGSSRGAIAKLVNTMPGTQALLRREFCQKPGSLGSLNRLNHDPTAPVPSNQPRERPTAKPAIAIVKDRHSIGLWGALLSLMAHPYQSNRTWAQALSVSHSSSRRLP